MTKSNSADDINELYRLRSNLIDMIFLIDKSIETHENVNSIEKMTKDQITLDIYLRNAKDISTV
jgi:hypothetical protein